VDRRRHGVVPDQGGHEVLVLEVHAVPSTATPSTPPTCSDVSLMAGPIPASSLGTGLGPDLVGEHRREGSGDEQHQRHWRDGKPGSEGAEAEAPGARSW
jgi:hypothetical protein